MKYAMTVKSSSTVGFWEDCKSANELSAKCEARRRFGDGYVGDVIELAIKNQDGQYQTVARKVIAPTSRWEHD